MREEEKKLLELDQTFSSVSQTKKAEAWDRYLAEDAIMVTGGHNPYIIGKMNIITGIKKLYELPKLTFYWEPKIARISEDKTMGYTTGIYTRTYEINGKPIKEIGKYTTIWRKESGTWEIVLDIGNEEHVDE